MKKLLLLLIFSGGLLFRVWQLDKIPPGFTPDEAAQGYSAYSILKTGRDEWGAKFPLNLRSFGDFKPPLQTYLMIPSVAFLGLNEFAVRLPNALLGSLAIIGIFLLASELFANEWIGLISASLLAFSPWHLPLSRGAFEANLTVFFTSFGVYFLLKMCKEKRYYWQILAALFLGLNMFSYHSAKLVTPLVVFLLFGFVARGYIARNRSARGWMAGKLVFLLVFGLLMAIAYSSFLSGGQTRGLDIAVFHPTDNWQAVKDEQWWSNHHGLAPLLARVLHNKIGYTAYHLAGNYLEYFSPQFIFSQGPGEGTYGMIPGRGVLWWWELPLLLWGLYVLVKKPNWQMALLSLLILASPLPAALAKGTRAANRAATMMPWIQIFMAWMIWEAVGNFSKLKVGRRTKNLGAIFAMVVILFFFASFLEDYFIQSPRKISEAMLYGRCQALRWAEKNYPKISRVIVSRKLSEPQAYVMFCLKYSPWLVQKQTLAWLKYKEKHLGFIDQMGEYKLGKYVFKELSQPSDSQELGVVMVGKPDELPGNIRPVKTIYYPNRQRAIEIYFFNKKMQLP